MSGSTLLASTLYAMSHNRKCQGSEECHWCGGPCTRLWVHNEPPRLPFLVHASTALRPGNAYICEGCWLWRRTRITVDFLPASGRLTEAQKDMQSPCDHSWWITHEWAWAVRVSEPDVLYALLLSPPSRFVLALTDGTVKNEIHRAVANDNAETRGDTPLRFTLNNIPHRYTIYELREALKTGIAEGKEPGVRVLLGLLGSYAPLYKPDGEERGRGRPKPMEKGVTSKVVARSA